MVSLEVESVNLIVKGLEMLASEGHIQLFPFDIANSSLRFPFHHKQWVFPLVYFVVT